MPLFTTPLLGSFSTFFPAVCWSMNGELSGSAGGLVPAEVPSVRQPSAASPASPELRPDSTAADSDRVAPTLPVSSPWSADDLDVASLPPICTPSRKAMPTNTATYFLPYQIKWVLDDHAIAIGEKSRRIGFTHASAYRAVERRLRQGTDLFYTSADLSAAREFMEECARWAMLFREICCEEGESLIDDADISAFSLRFANGARIIAGSSNPKFLRGKGGDVDADEFAFHQQPRELYKVAQPAALMWGHQLRLWSTHNGAGSFFHRLVQSSSNIEPAAAPEESECEPQPITGQPIAVHRVTLISAVNQGLVERIRKLPQPDLNARRAFIDEIRASCPDEAAFREEYLCEPSAEGSALLSLSLIGTCEVPSLRLQELDQLAAGDPAGGSLFAGFDVGRKRDRSVLWVIERVGDVLWTRHVRVMGDMPFAQQEQLLDRLLVCRRVRRLCIDSTGIGLMLAERLAGKFGHRVEPIHFTADVKTALAMPLVRLFEGKLIRIPAEQAIREDLHKIRRTITAAHHVRLAAPRDADGHADRFWALSLACHAADQMPAATTAGAPRKPVGW